MDNLGFYGGEQDAMLTMQDANRAFDLIKEAYRPHILPELLNRTAADVYVFCNERDFELKFQTTYITAFKKANAILIPDKITSADINGFVNAEADYEERHIYMPQRENLKWGTLAHEAIHFFSHKAFYPIFYMEGGQRPFQVEGATEWLTREADPSLGYRQNYQNHYLKTKSWLGSDKGNLVRMMNFLFRGVTTNLDAIHS